MPRAARARRQPLGPFVGDARHIGTIDPEGSRIEPGTDHYFALLRNLAKDLKACLAPVSDPPGQTP